VSGNNFVKPLGVFSDNRGERSVGVCPAVINYGLSLLTQGHLLPSWVLQILSMNKSKRSSGIIFIMRRTTRRLAWVLAPWSQKIFMCAKAMQMRLSKFLLQRRAIQFLCQSLRTKPSRKRLFFIHLKMRKGYFVSSLVYVKSSPWN